MKALMQKLNPALWVIVVFALAFSACSEDLGLAGTENGENSGWPLNSVDPKQTWMTSETVQLDISIDDEADITAQTIMNEKVTVLGQKHLKGSGVMFLDVPQGIGGSFGLVYDDGVSPKQYRQINLAGNNGKVIDVSFQSESATQASAPAIQRASTRAATAPSLYSYSILPDSGYMNFGSWAWEDIAIALTEGLKSYDNHKAMIDYEIMSRGEVTSGGEYHASETVYLSMLYGYTGTTDTRVVGYYTHSGNYSDIEFHDIADVLKYDYFNGKAKVQYQLDNNTSQWYDANFDHTDGDKLPAYQKPAQNINTPSNAQNSERRGDDAYNTLLVSEIYGDRVTAIRGLTFELKISEKKVYGFHLREEKALDERQKTKLKNLGIPDDKLPKYKANYTNANMNTGSGKQVIRSAMAIYDNFTFVGLDDNTSGGDYDCNDVTFALSNVRGEKLIPKFTEASLNSSLNEETLKEHPEYSNPPSLEEIKHQSWTLAFENAGMDNDFDFNDVVLKVTPNTTTHQAEVKLLATGAQRKTEVYFDGTLLGEVHTLFGVDTNTFVNTTSSTATRKAVTLESISWPEDATMETQRMKFSLKVYNEDGTLDREFSMADLLNDRKSPQALCVAGDWQWPKERVNVYTAYPLIGKWGVNFNKEEYSNWYSQPKADAVVTLLEK